MWKNIVEPDRSRTTIWRKRIAYCIPKATDTHSVYVTLIAFPMQQWLHEHTTMLRNTHIACLVSLSVSHACVKHLKTPLSSMSWFINFSRNIGIIHEAPRHLIFYTFFSLPYVHTPQHFAFIIFNKAISASYVGILRPNEIKNGEHLTFTQRLQRTVLKYNLLVCLTGCVKLLKLLIKTDVSLIEIRNN